MQRTLALLAKSSPENRNPVRLLFYGQPFQGGSWWTNLVVHLQESYPNAEILAENRCVDLHNTDQLVRLAESAIFPFRPDLLVLCTIGDHHETRRLVQMVRERSSADVLLLTVPPRTAEALNEVTDPTVIAPDPKRPALTPQSFNSYFNYVWLPMVSDEFGAALGDLRTGWKKYLRDNNLPIGRLAADGTRFTPEAESVTAELIKPFFNPPTWVTPEDPWDNPRVNTYEIPRDVSWSKGRLRLEFTGNRVEAVLDSALDSAVDILLDGKPPGDLPPLRIAGRPSNIPGTPWPALLRVGNHSLLLDETWTATIQDVSTNGGAIRFRFAVRGSKTGPDGEGSSDFEFLSRSHRVVIQPADWNLAFVAKRYAATIPSTFDVQWSSEFQGANALPSGAGQPGRRTSLVVANGLEPGRHVLEITANTPGTSALKAIRVYRPAVVAKSRKGR